MLGISDFEAMREFRLLDVAAFLAVQRCGSVSGAARELKVTPSQVSKAITRLEKLLNVRLFARTTRGVSLSETGLRLVPKLQEIVERVWQIRHADEATDGVRELTVAGPSYLINTFLPPIAQRQPGLRLRALELPPALVRAYAAENFFDIALTPSLDPLPSTWTQAQVGEVKKALFARPSLAATLGEPPVAPQRLLAVPFISPIYSNNGQHVPVQDDCPHPRGARRLGHEAQTIGLGLAIASRIDQLIFGPVIAARDHLARGSLVEIAVEGWDVRDPLYLVTNLDRVLAKEQHALRKILTETLDECQTGHPEGQV